MEAKRRESAQKFRLKWDETTKRPERLPVCVSVCAQDCLVLPSVLLKAGIVRQSCCQSHCSSVCEGGIPRRWIRWVAGGQLRFHSTS